MVDRPKASHLIEHVTDRGFTHLPAINSTYGGTVRVYESSAAEGAHVWLSIKSHAKNDPNQEEVEGIAHLTTDNAWRLAEQLIMSVLTHYQHVNAPIDRMFDVELVTSSEDEFEFKTRRRPTS